MSCREHHATCLQQPCVPDHLAQREHLAWEGTEMEQNDDRGKDTSGNMAVAARPWAEKLAQLVTCPGTYCAKPTK